MSRSSLFARLQFAAAFAAMGVQSLVLDLYVMRLEPIPKAWPGHHLGPWVTGAILLIACAGLLTRRFARLGALLLAAVLLVWVLGVHLPIVIAKPLAFNALFETFALFGGAWALAASLPASEPRKPWDRLADLGRNGGPLCFGLSLPAFGVSHFMYPGFVAGFMPAWIPYRPFWAIFAGCAHIAAGLGIVTRVLGRLAAVLAGIMYGSWVFLVHIPRILAAPKDAFEWNGAFVAAALSASAFIVAGCLKPRRAD